MNTNFVFRRRIAAVLLVVAVGVITIVILHRADRRTTRLPRIAAKGGDAGQPEMQVPAVSRQPIDLGADGEFVGSAACRQCHRQIAEAFSRHPMALSMAPIDEAAVIEDYGPGATFSPSGGRRQYRVERANNRVWHHEKLIIPAGEAAPAAEDVVYDQAVEISHVVGSGARGRSYIIDRDGQFFASSISWYTAAHRWDLAPGYPPDNNLRFERLVHEDCLFCHAGRMSAAQPDAARYAQPPFQETAIGCERCHGPGRRHVDDQISGAGSGGRGPAIVNPARLSADRRESVCNQCHLHGEIRIPRHGMRIADFRAGQRLDQVLCVLVQKNPPTREGALRAVSQVEQMRASTCYDKSRGDLGCISCHDPHAVPDPAEREMFFRRKCLNCHADHGCSLPEGERLAQSANDSCIACHMPRIPGGGIPHAAQTDHRVPRRPSTTNKTGAISDLSALVFSDRSQESVPEWEQSRARGIMLVELGSDRPDRVRLAAQAERLLKESLRHAADDLAVLQSLGTACLWQSRGREALECWERALAISPDRIETLKSHAVLCQALGEFEKSSRSYERLLRLSPWQSEYHSRYSDLLAHMGDWKNAVVEAEKALLIDPAQIDDRTFLVAAYARLGREDESRRQLAILQKLRAATSD